ncbi:MAG: MATE family efflux transporter [Ruminococcaceae bacterium]|nr:MATE family efflux transporter [Oscillospiraceae bacterium]
MDMVNGPILSKIIRFSLPLIATGVLQLLYNAADVVVVGRFDGPQALAALGCTGSLINLIINVFMGLAIGASVAVAQDYGAGDTKGVHKVIHTAIPLSAGCGVAVAIIGVCFSGTFLRWMGTPENVLPLASKYLIVYFLGAPGSLIYNFGASILRSVGDTKRPLIMLAISGIVNVVLNLVFVIVLHMGVVGVGLATIASQYLSMVMVVRYLIKVDGCCHLDLGAMKIYRDKLNRIIRVGLPAGLQGSVFSVSNVVIQSSINSFGDLVVAGNTAAANIEGFVYVAMNSVYQAALTFTGQNVGAKKHERIHRVVFTCAGIVCVIGLVLGVGVYLCAEPLLSIYLPDDPEAIPYGVTRLFFVSLPYMFCGLMEIFTGGQRGMGLSFTPMVTSLVGSCLFRMLWVVTVFARFGTLNSLFLVYPISWVMTTFAHMTFYLIYKHKHFPNPPKTLTE